MKVISRAKQHFCIILPVLLAVLLMSPIQGNDLAPDHSWLFPGPFVVEISENNDVLPVRGTTTPMEILDVAFVQSRAWTDQLISKQVFIDKDVQGLTELIGQVVTPNTFHLFSHGKPGALLLDNQWLSGEDLVAFIRPLLQDETHLNIYGCHFAQGEKGQAAVEYLEAALGVAVAASDDLTGIDGDWDLEVGQAVSALNLTDYDYNLQSCNCTEYLYVNDVDLDGVHKFEVNPINGGLTEITNSGGIWLDNINNPHGAVMDVNGFMWIAEKNGSFPSFFGSNLQKVTCDGEVEDVLFTNNFDSGRFNNFVTIGNYLYVNGRSNAGVKLYDLCNETYVGRINLPTVVNNWELMQGQDGNLYVIDQRTEDLDIYQIPSDPALYTNPGTVDVTTPYLQTDVSIPYTPGFGGIYGFWGLEQDENGNWYVMNTSITDGAVIYVINSAGTTINTITDPAGIAGFSGGRGLEYSVETGRLYVASGDDDCVAVIDASTGTYFSSLSIPGGGGKDLSLVTECCPTSSAVTVDATLCSSDVGEMIFLQELLACDGTICQGSWSEGGSNTGISYDACNLAVTINAIGASGSFTLSSDGTGNNPQCGAFNITLNIKVIDIDTDDLASVACSGTDAISLDLNPTGTGIGTMYNVSVSGGGATSISPTTASYGSATTFTLNDNSAGGGDVTITITDVDDVNNACPRDVVVTDPGACAPTCSIDADGLASVTCGGTDAISLELTPTGTGVGATYNVSVSGGAAATISPTSGTYGMATTFTLNDNSAGGGNVIITITDVDDNMCTRDVTVTDPGACAPTCSIDADGLASVVCIGTDAISLSLTPTGANVGATYNVSVSGAAATTISPTSGMYNMATTFTLNDNSAGGGNVTITITDVDGNTCTRDVLVTDPGACMVAATVSLGSTVFEDGNNNGMQDGSDAGIANVLVVLYMDGGDGATDGADDTAIVTGADGILGTADDGDGPDGINGTADDGQPGMLTDVNGDYFFAGLAEGDYYVQIPMSEFGAGAGLENIPVSSNTVNGFAGETDPDSDNADGDDEGIQSGSGMVTTSNIISLAVGAEPTDADTETAQGNDQDNPANGYVDADGNMTLDFGFFAPVSLGDTTFVDLNENGLQDLTEPDLEGVTVTLFNANGTPVALDAEGNPYTNTTTTNGDGFYEFTNLPPGNYYVVFDLSTVPGNEFLEFTNTNGGNEADDSDADANGQTENTGDIASGDRFPDLDAGVICAVSVTVNDPFVICATGTIDLVTGASITPDNVAGFGGTWTSNGTGTFDDGAGEFGVATSYTPSTADIAAGEVTLTLTTDDPMAAPFNSAICGPISESVTITILKVDCGSFFWDGSND